MTSRLLLLDWKPHTFAMQRLSFLGVDPDFIME